MSLFFKDLRTRIKSRIWRIIKENFYYQRIEDFPFVLNINLKPGLVQKKVLICYQTHCYFRALDSVQQKRTQPYEILSIINVFTESNYVVDLLDCNEIRIPEAILDRNYDLIFGFGESHYRITNLKPQAISVLYMTENTPEFSYREEQKRLDYYFERHGKRHKIIRSGKFYKKYHLEKTYTHVITMGEPEFLMDKYPSPYSIFPTGLINPEFKFGKKNHYESRKNFLWMGSLGAIHKGLDLLLDVFSERKDVTLHICGLSDMEKKMLKLKPSKNIIDHGYVLVSSDKFIDLTNTCTFIILPSCSEGCSTSILTGMLHGLIPIVMKDSGFNRLSGHAVFLDTYRIDYLQSQITYLSDFDVEELSGFSKKVYDFACKNFTINAFSENMRNILRYDIGI